MRKARADIALTRRASIVEAAVSVIAEKGLQKLSLSQIEKKAKMSRGQLTYYFKAKEDILLAVFDRLLEMMRQRARADAGHPTAALCAVQGWERLRGLLTWFILTPPADPAFHALQHTFLSQIGHREDFRRRLASLYEEWRGHMAGDVAEEAGRPPAVSARTAASLVQAVLHGLAMQRAADPDAFDRHEMLTLVLELLGNYLRPAGEARAPAADGGPNGRTRGGTPDRPKRPPRRARAGREGEA
jgi:AcrR family transcriptional regulator